MRCPKCNSRIDNTIEYCNYCGERVKSNNRDDQYEYSKAYSNVKNDYDTDHTEQYGYSKTYSGSTKEYDTPHETQYNYSKTYSDSQKEYDTPHDDQYSYSQLYSNSNTSSITSDEDYIKAYLGYSLYKDIIKKEIPISIAAIFFGPMYLLYKKLWLSWILSSIILITTTFTIRNLFFSSILVNTILSMIAHKIILNKANNDIAKIKDKNPDKDSRELLELCKQKGKPAGIGNVIILNIIIWIVIMTVALLITV